MYVLTRVSTVIPLPCTRPRPACVQRARVQRRSLPLLPPSLSFRSVLSLTSPHPPLLISSASGLIHSSFSVCPGNSSSNCSPCRTPESVKLIDRGGSAFSSISFFGAIVVRRWFMSASMVLPFFRRAVHADAASRLLRIATCAF